MRLCLVSSACPISIKWGLITTDGVTGSGRNGGAANKRSGCGDFMRATNLHDWSPAYELDGRDFFASRQLHATPTTTAPHETYGSTTHTMKYKTRIHSGMASLILLLTESSLCAHDLSRLLRWCALVYLEQSSCKRLQMNYYPTRQLTVTSHCRHPAAGL